MYILPIHGHVGFPGGSGGKESTGNVGNLGSIPGMEQSPGGRHGNPLQYSCLENPHGQRSLASYSPWGRKELDVTERLSTAQHTHPLLIEGCFGGVNSLTPLADHFVPSGNL